MAIGKLVYKLPEEREEFETAQNGIRYKIVLSEIDGWLRNLAKYQDKDVVSIDELRSKIREELDGLDL